MRTRLLLGGLVAALLTITVVTFYNFGSIPTDENIFVSIPSGLYISRPHTDLEASWVSGRKEHAGKPWQDFLRGGDFLIGVNSRIRMRIPLRFSLLYTKNFRESHRKCSPAKGLPHLPSSSLPINRHL